MRSRVTHTTSNGRNRSTTAAGSATWSFEHSDFAVVSPDARPIGNPQRDVLVIVEDRNLHR
jgi:hypothetical protein